ncbi:MAG: hypothetical protein ACXWRE_06605 [Pseudobdellovibrionaceae bacterium]
MNIRPLKSLIIISYFLAVAPIFASALQAGESCEAIFELSQDLAQSPAFPQDPATLQQVQAEIKNSKVASDYFMTEIRNESNKLKTQFQNKVLELDFLCVGAGPQCASSSLVLGGTHLRSLVLEKTNLVAKTFAQKDFFINSTESQGLSMHDFPNGVGSLAAHTSQKYAHSSQLAAHIQMQQFASNIPVLLETTMTKIREIKKEGKLVLEISTDQGITIITKNLILGTGLGEVGTKVKDANYQAAFENNYQKHLERPDALQTIMSTDSFLAALKNASAMGKKISMPKRLVLVGDGDGSRISVEGLNSPFVELPKEFHITWIGNSANTPEQYLLRRNGGDRYVHLIVPFYKRGQVQGIPGHVQTWEVRSDSSMHLTTADKETGKVYEADGDMIVDATGYENKVPQLLSDLGAQPKLADVMGPLPEMNLQTTVLGRQFLDGSGKPLPIFVVGAASGLLATPEELAPTPNKNPISIFNTIPRTSMLISNLAGSTPAPSKHGVREGRPAVRPAKDLINEAKKKRQQQVNPTLLTHLTRLNQPQKLGRTRCDILETFNFQT